MAHSRFDGFETSVPSNCFFHLSNFITGYTRPSNTERRLSSPLEVPSGDSIKLEQETHISMKPATITTNAEAEKVQTSDARVATPRSRVRRARARLRRIHRRNSAAGKVERNK
ncbi:MAG TPA: hypothetical protein VF666_04600 [Pyrinomonadaceae bacterium]